MIKQNTYKQFYPGFGSPRIITQFPDLIAVKLQHTETGEIFANQLIQP